MLFPKKQQTSILVRFDLDVIVTIHGQDIIDPGDPMEAIEVASLKSLWAQIEDDYEKWFRESVEVSVTEGSGLSVLQKVGLEQIYTGTRHQDHEYIPTEKLYFNMLERFEYRVAATVVFLIGRGLTNLGSEDTLDTVRDVLRKILMSPFDELQWGRKTKLYLFLTRNRTLISTSES